MFGAFKAHSFHFSNYLPLSNTSIPPNLYLDLSIISPILFRKKKKNSKSKFTSHHILFDFISIFNLSNDSRDLQNYIAIRVRHSLTHWIFAVSSPSRGHGLNLKQFKRQTKRYKINFLFEKSAIIDVVVTVITIIMIIITFIITVGIIVIVRLYRT